MWAGSITSSKFCAGCGSDRKRCVRNGTSRLPVAATLTPEETSKKNELYASLLGWTAATFGASGFDNMLAKAIAPWQQRVGLTVNGVCDQASYRAWLTDKPRTQTAGSRNVQLAALRREARKDERGRYCLRSGALVAIHITYGLAKRSAGASID